MATQTDTIVRVDPKTLLVGPNVRREVDLSKEFVESIKDLGVRVPITAYETPDGLVVVDGQRRTLASVDAGVAEVPVFVTEAPTDESRVIDQVVVNRHRAGLVDTDTIAAVQQLVLFDMAAPAIAKKLGVRKELAEDVAKVQAAPAALKHFEKTGILRQAVTIADFEGQPEQADLIKLASGNNSWQMEERARDLKAKRDTISVKAEIEAMGGVALVAEPSGYGTGVQPVSHLYLDAEFSKDLDDVAHSKVVQLAGDGLVAWPGWVHDSKGRHIGVVYGVKGWQDRGMHVRSYHLTVPSNGKPSTPEEAEALKLERRQSRLNTKEWVESTGLRIEWLQQLVSRRTMPKGWEPLVAERLVQNDYAPSMFRAIATVLQLKENPQQGMRGTIQKHLAKAPQRSPQIMLAVWAGAIEGGGDFDKKGWQGTWQVPLDQTKAYLKKLAEWGYPLTEFEQLVVAGKVKKTA